MYSNNIVNFQESTTILNACTKSLETYRRDHVYICVCVCVCVWVCVCVCVFVCVYSNNIVNFQESTTILNACTKMSGNLLKAPRISHEIWTWKYNNLI